MVVQRTYCVPTTLTATDMSQNVPSSVPGGIQSSVPSNVSNGVPSDVPDSVPRGRHAYHGKHEMGVSLSREKESARYQRFLSRQVAVSNNAAMGSSALMTGENGLHTAPPQPPIKLDEKITMDPKTPLPLLWKIARERPDLRRWLIVNPSVPPELLEYIAQKGGPGVGQGLRVLFNALDLLGEQSRAQQMLPAVMQSTSDD